MEGGDADSGKVRGNGSRWGLRTEATAYLMRQYDVGNCGMEGLYAGDAIDG